MNKIKFKFTEKNYLLVLQVSRDIVSFLGDYYEDLSYELNQTLPDLLVYSK